MHVTPEELESFLDLFDDKKRLPSPKRLKLTRQLVEAAGYEIVVFEPGNVHGRNITGPDESESYVANPITKLRVCSHDDNTEPSIWLEQLTSRLSGVIRHQGREAAAEKLTESLSKPGPFKPVVISKFGETICETFSQNLTHSGDDHSLSLVTHMVCQCYVDLKSVSPSHNALVCRGCHMRVVIPKSLATVGDLRHYFQHFQLLT